MSDITNLTKVVENKRKAEVVEMLQSALNKVEQEGASNVLILMKTDGIYTRFSTKMDDVMEILAQLEVLKYDILRRMHD
jgi:hypothetical protein